MQKTILVLLILSAWVIDACNYPVPSKINTEKTAISTEVQNKSDNFIFPTQDIKKEIIFEYTDFNFIYAYGVDKQRVTNIVYTIQPIYFKDLKELEIIYSNKDVLSNSKDGLYTPYKITLYVYQEGDRWIKQTLLHELKHHSCFLKEGYISADNIQHQGCFLNDEEYGSIK